MEGMHKMSELSVDEILRGFAVFDGIYKRAEVDAAIACREEVAPRLIEVLDAVLSNPERASEDESNFGHVYALMLLGHFREPRAHRVVVQLASLPGDLPYRLFGDTVTEDLAVVLLRTCDGSFDAIKGLVQNRDADDYCRGAAAKAISYGVVEGSITREEALSFLGGMLEEGAADVSGAFYDIVASCIHDLYPEELMDRIESAYANGLIHSFHVDIGSFRSALARGKEKCLVELRTELEDRSLNDVHKSMSWWACFQERPQRLAVEKPAGQRASKEERKKAKRKIARASRKRNR